MVTSEFALFSDIINIGVGFACFCADLTHGKKGHRVEGEVGGVASPMVWAFLANI